MQYYDYVCSDCESRFELKRSIKDVDTPAECPHCHGAHVARQLSRVAAFSHSEGGSVSSLGGSSCGCGSCGGGSCGSCGSNN